MTASDTSLAGLRVVITGPTGWIGQAFMMRLARALGPGWADHVALFGPEAADVTAIDGTVLPMRPLTELSPADVDGAIVVHLAYLTKEKADLLGDRQFSDTNLAIDDLLLKAIDAAAPHAVFAASSGAAALAADGRDRHPYGLSKLRQEDRLLEWSARSGVPAIAGRIWSIAGPFMNKVGSYALGDMLTQARNTGRIRIAAPVPVFRSYLHVSDLADLVLAALTAGIGRDRALDLCGAEPLEMSDLAERVAAHVGLAEHAVERGHVDYLRPSVYLGSFPDTRALAMQVKHRIAGFDRQLADTDRWLFPQTPV